MPSYHDGTGSRPLFPTPTHCPMKKTYSAPALDEVGTVARFTAAFGTAPQSDFSEFPLIPASTGSFDLCDPNRADTDPDSNCRR